MERKQEVERFMSSSLAAKLQADFPNIEKDLAAFNEKYGAMVRADTSAMTLILRSHLIVEHFLDEYLVAAHPGIRDWSGARLRFSQKIALIDGTSAAIDMLVPGIRALNRARNKLAHSLDSPLPRSDLEPMENFVRIWRTALGEPVPDGMEFIPLFALHAAGWLQSATKMIERHCPDSGATGLASWYRD